MKKNPLQLANTYLSARTIEGAVVSNLVSVVKNHLGSNIQVGSLIFPVTTATGDLNLNAQEVVSIFKGTVSVADDQAHVQLTTTALAHFLPREVGGYLVFWKNCPHLLQYDESLVHVIAFDRVDDQSFVLAILVPGGMLFGPLDKRSVLNEAGKLVYQPNISQSLEKHPISRQQFQSSVTAAL